MSINEKKENMVELKAFNFVCLFILTKLTRCTSQKQIATDLELTLGLCVNKFPVNITTFDFYFSFNNLTSFQSRNLSGTLNRTSLDSCSNYCCNENNTSKLIYINLLNHGLYYAIRHFIIMNPQLCLS